VEEILMKRFLLAAALVALASPAWPQAVVVSACGAKTFPVGSQNYVTMNPQGYLCVSTTTTVVVSTAAPPSPQPAPEPNKREEK
jgi:hypothetical protein